MTRIFTAVGNRVVGALAEAGALWQLAASTVERTLAGPFRGERVRFGETVLQTVRAGYDSLPLVALLSVLIGMILALQSAYQLDQMGALSLVARLVAITMTRELAPLITAIIVAGRVGSAIAAELGTMKVSQEVDALTVMGIDPVSYLVVPRILGLLVSVPCLVLFSNLIGIAGGAIIAVTTLGLGGRTYVLDSLNALIMEDIVIGLIKAVVFAGIIGLVGCQQGLATRGGAEEVGRATTTSVVRAIVLVITADLFVTAIYYVKG
ncbi:MAG: ABC transporter permease [Acidobacteriota bacterium]|nr:ABC transporter permease [Acidobacteriota bacterium]